MRGGEDGPSEEGRQGVTRSPSILTPGCGSAASSPPKTEHSTIASGMGVPKVSRHTVKLENGLEVQGAAVSMGNPHFVIFVEGLDFSLAGVSWEATGQEICFHSDFPDQTNVEFVRVVNRREIEIRIFERGVGPTTSSGTGSCASAAAAIALRDMKTELIVTAPGGPQSVTWPEIHSEMTLTGPAELIAKGEAFL